MKYLKRIVWFAARTILVAKDVASRKKNKRKEEHEFILGLLVNSDKRAKKLIELEEVRILKARFAKHPESKKFCDTPQRIDWLWDVFPSGEIRIPLDRDKNIMPYDKDKRLATLAHEFGHLIMNVFSSGSCVYNIRACFSRELLATVAGIWLLKKINVSFSKEFWDSKLKFKRIQCEECLKIIKQGECPKEEQEKIKKYLRIISPVSSKKNGVIFLAVSKILQAAGY